MHNPWAKLSEHSKLQIIKWSYLAIVVLATFTLTLVVIKNQQLVHDIQKDRARVAYSNCLDQNAKNEELKQFLADQGSTDPAAQKFINVLAPKRNCYIYTKNLLGVEPDESN